MAKQFEYAKNRFLPLEKVIQANAYSKEGKHRVAIDLESNSGKSHTVYTDELASAEEARNVAQNIISMI